MKTQKTKHQDQDIRILSQCCKALDRSTSPRMLKANVEFLVDRYVRHPNRTPPNSSGA